MKIAVGSKNPVKIEAARLAFLAVWPGSDCEMIECDAPSGVSEQPMSDEESIQGARNRARHAIKNTNAGYGVGLEGGLHKIGNQYFDCGWIAVVDREGNEGVGSTARILTPPRIDRKSTRLNSSHRL